MIDRKSIFTPSVVMGLKVFLLFILVLIFQGPLYSIRSLVRERESRSEEAEREVIGHYGGQQVISGPVMVISYRKMIDDDEHVMTAFYTPEELDISADMSTEIRKRGIFDVPVYDTAVEMGGYFSFPDLTKYNIRLKDIIWENSGICFDLTDMRSIAGDITFVFNGSERKLIGGATETGIYSQGLFYRPESLEKGSIYAFSLKMNLRGGRQLDFIPIGKKSEIELTSDWLSPSFNGARLPDSRELTTDGFNAQWTVLSIGRNFPETWTNGHAMSDRIRASRFGFRLYSSVDHYLMSQRSIKYGLLFIVLPFICFFLFETVWKLRIHIFQYLLVGVFESIFFLLLLSLSEHLGFNLSFLIAALLTTAAISYYANAFVKKTAKTVFLTVILAISFLFLFIIIQNEDYALLIGASGIFLIALIVMLVTRKIDWYQLGKNIGNGSRKKRISGTIPE